jgi:rare lipoprotein A (peptidoglycan hydrolase)
LTTLIAAAFSTFAVAIGGPSTNSTQKFVSASNTAPQPAMRQGQPCRKLWNAFMARRAIRAAYSGTRDVTHKDKAYLRTIIRCQRNTAATPHLLKFEKRARHAWFQRRHPPMYTQLASWYNDAGGTACGFHATYGVANKSLPCGTHVLARYHGRQVTMIVQDRGPYVGDRRWDLNQNTAGALGFSGVAYIQVSVAG